MLDYIKYKRVSILFKFKDPDADFMRNFIFSDETIKEFGFGYWESKKMERSVTFYTNHNAINFPGRNIRDLCCANIEIELSDGKILAKSDCQAITHCDNHYDQYVFFFEDDVCELTKAAP